MAIQDVNVVGDTDSLLRDVRNLLAGRNITTASSGVISLGGHLYSASVTGLVPVSAGATDIFTITTAATTPAALRLKKIIITGTTSDDEYFPFSVVVRSTINTGGTFTSPTVMPWNGTPSGVTVATVKAYTANPTTGVLVGEIASQTTSTATTSVGHTCLTPVVFDFGLHGYYTQTANTVIAVNMNGFSSTAGHLSIYAVWSESES